ncbi:amino acid ABC transporter substrate-binding protein [Aliikangiella marina]|uniref:Amino acid ABC transporter substrate-binding protein n=1 Tax=Aliikangiella marina TaxID=1712262 RepID=A0A545THT0_9GAMM|nr:transporter substrate-binding domain-containing protein [Aliikangiella marina]TQV76790.1 amino acid ABC transporter substrate-binding protein [Aliikangiella marina]
MNTAIRIVTCLFFLILSTSASSSDVNSQNAKVITIVDGGDLIGYPPYYYYPKSTLGTKEQAPKGFIVDKIRTAAEDAGLEVNWVSVPFKRAIMMMQKGEVDAMFPVIQTQDRKAYMYFKDLELAKECNHLVTLKSRGLKANATSYEIREDDVIGITDAYSYGKYFDDLINSGKVKTIKVSEDRQLTRLLLSKRIDMAIGNQLTMSWHLEQFGAVKNVVFSEKSLSCSPLHLAFSRHKAGFKTISKILADSFKKLDTHKSKVSGVSSKHYRLIHDE